jgi:tRNA threonylcarbamoyladenosine biosynthesis protein TsaB
MLMPAIDDLLRRAGLGPGDLGGIAVDVGPGLFTGLRVGLATAKAMAAALGTPIAGATSLETLAYPHRRRPGLLASIVDARRAEVYWALYRCDGETPVPVLLKGPAVGPPEGVASELGVAGEPVLAVGDGAWRYRDVFASHGLGVGGAADMWPSPAVVAELCYGRIVAAGPDGLPELEPVYLRQADVRIGWEQVGGRVSGAPQGQQATS